MSQQGLQPAGRQHRRASRQQDELGEGCMFIPRSRAAKGAMLVEQIAGAHRSSAAVALCSWGWSSCWPARSGKIDGVPSRIGITIGHWARTSDYINGFSGLLSNQKTLNNNVIRRPGPLSDHDKVATRFARACASLRRRSGYGRVHMHGELQKATSCGLLADPSPTPDTLVGTCKQSGLTFPGRFSADLRASKSAGSRVCRILSRSTDRGLT
jgi:hypothetical protein